MVNDILIIGSGPAGLTAAMYAQRAGFEATVLEKIFTGGQAATTYEIENYPGYLGISGPELAQKFEAHAKRFGARIINENVIELELDKKIKTAKTQSGVYEAKAIIIATGASPRKLGVSGEQELMGRGVSYCATCDGAFYRKKIVAVVGGGNTAVEDALFLARLCEKVYLIHRRDSFRADRSLTRKLEEAPNIELVLDNVVEKIIGNEAVTGIAVKNTKSGETMEYAADGVFVAVGIEPNNELYSDKLEIDSGGYIITNERLKTNLAGVFAAGDARSAPLRQIITAAADGAIAAYSASAYITAEF